SSSGEPLPFDGSGVVPSASEVPADEPAPSESFSSSSPESELSESLLREPSEPEPVSESDSLPSESPSADVSARSVESESDVVGLSVELVLSSEVSLSEDDPSVPASLAEPSSAVTPSVSADSLLSLSEPSDEVDPSAVGAGSVSFDPPSAPASES